VLFVNIASENKYAGQNPERNELCTTTISLAPRHLAEMPVSIPAIDH